MSYSWVPLLGEFDVGENEILFKGKTISTTPTGDSLPAIGNLLCDAQFSGGSICADLEFTGISLRTACEIIIFYYNDAYVTHIISAGIGSGPLFAIREYREFRNNVSPGWTWLAGNGERTNFKSGKKYRVKVALQGSRVSLYVDDVNITSSNILFPLPQSHVGIWCSDFSDSIKVSNFRVDGEKPKAFVVMEFSSPYNEIYSDVIKRVCTEAGLEVVRADETYGPGIIIADIARQIVESKLIIADVTPANPNVFYEVGFAHAMGKPTILIAEKSTKLPFDISPFRILLYEDSISGKVKIEEGLRKHVQAILTQMEGR